MDYLDQDLTYRLDAICSIGDLAMLHNLKKVRTYM